MSTNAAARVIADALALTDEERAAVAEELLASLDATKARSRAQRIEVAV